MNRKFYEAAQLQLRAQAIAAMGRIEHLLEDPSSVGSDQDVVEEIMTSAKELLLNENAAANLENYFGKKINEAATALPESQQFAMIVQRLDAIVQQTLPLVEKSRAVTPEMSATMRSSQKKQKIIDAAKKAQKKKAEGKTDGDE